MKRAWVGVLVLATVVCLATAASAVEQKNVGCGLGTMLFEGQNGLLSQVGAATTNGSFGNQTFGVSSGTLECEHFNTWTMNEKVNTFVADNMDSLAKDIAKGEGEYLDTMTALMKMDQSQRQHFYALLQKNFSRIYSSPAVTPAEVVANISQVVSSM